MSKMDGQAFIQSLAAAAFKARGLGDGGDR